MLCAMNNLLRTAFVSWQSFTVVKCKIQEKPLASVLRFLQLQGPLT